MLELEHGFRVADIHTRLEPDAARRRRGGAGDPETIEREMHQAGVVRAVVVSGLRENGYLKANNGVARMCVERPFVAFARVTGARDPGTGAGARLRNLTTKREGYHTSPADVEQYAYDDRFAGFKLHPAVDGLPDEAVLDQLADVELPVVVHAGERFPPVAVAEHLLGRGFPVVLEHFGGYPLDRELMADGIALLDGHEACFLDTSFVPFRERRRHGDTDTRCDGGLDAESVLEEPFASRRGVGTGRRGVSGQVSAERVPRAMRWSCSSRWAGCTSAPAFRVGGTYADTRRGRREWRGRFLLTVARRVSHSASAAREATRRSAI